jgi:predicted PurR-regulated permease PerM
MPVADARTARVLITVLLFALGLGFLYVARQTLMAFLFAIFFAYLMSPLVSSLERLLHGRVRAIAVIYLLLLSLVVLFSFPWDRGSATRARAWASRCPRWQS